VEDAPMSRRLWLPLAVTPLVLASTVFAHERQPLREARSENGRFRLQIRPGRDHAARARATLLERAKDRGPERRVWQARLVNEVAPLQACIRNDGRFMVTLDEFRRGGAAHAVVVYDQRGKLLREFTLPEVLRGDDWKHAKLKREAIEWLGGARFSFGDEPPQFLIKLRWGREIRINLEKVAIVGQEDGRPPDNEANDAILPEIRALLEANAMTTDPTPQTNPAADGSAQAAAEALRQIAAVLGLHPELTQEVTETEAQGNETNADAKEDEAVAQQTDAEPPEAQQDSVAGNEEIAAESSDASQTPGTQEEMPTVGERALPEGSDEPQPTFAGNSELAGWPVPMPDPRNPVDYVAIIVEQTVTDGPSAVPLYDAAGAAHVAFEGDYDLYDAALHGDPEALSSPEITEWLQANQTALANYRAATQFDYRGQVTALEGAGVMGILLPALSQRRALSRVALIEAKSLEAQGNIGAALDNYASNFIVGRHMSQGTTLIDNLVGIAIQRQAAESLLDSLASPTGEQIDYTQLAERLERDYQPLRPMAEVFQGERMCCLDLLQELYEWNPDTREYAISESGMEKVDWAFGESTEGEEVPKAGPEFRAAIESIGFKGMVAEANEHYDRLTESALLPYQDSRQVSKDLEAAVSSPEYKQHNPLVSGLLPSLGRAYYLGVHAQATRNATRLIANLKAYRQRHGDYPDSLAVLGETDMAVDPFTGANFAYRRDGSDFTLYSLGANGVDDGGVHDGRGETNDIRYWPRPTKSK
jgi:hypothetical protein